MPGLGVSIGCRRRDPFQIQEFGYCSRTFSRCIHFEYPSYNRRGFLINDGSTLFIRSHFISVRRFLGGIYSLFRIGSLYRAYLLAGIGSMPLVKNVHDRHHFHRAAVTVFRVYVVLYGYEPYPERRKYIINILPHLDVISAKPRKIFYDDGIYNARLCVVQQPLHFGAVES